MEKAAASAGVPDAITPLREVWDRYLRNAVFHSDYALHGGEVRIMRGDGVLGGPKIYSHDRVLTLVNRALAYFESLRVLRSYYLGSYLEPKEIPADARFTNREGERAMVMVRDGYGAIGLKDAFTLEELRAGYLPWHVRVFSRTELELIRQDQTRAFFPAEDKDSSKTTDST